MSGPRDWTRSDGSWLPGRRPRRRRRGRDGSLLVEGRGRRPLSVRGGMPASLGWILSGALGAFASGAAAAPLYAPSWPVVPPSLLAAAGFGAVVVGVGAAARSRHRVGSGVRFVGLLGIGSGLIATLFAVALMTTPVPQAAVALPVSRWSAAVPAQPVATTEGPAAPAARSSTPVRPAASADAAVAEPPQAALAVQTDPNDLGPILGGMVFRLKQQHIEGEPWPSVLRADSGGRIPVVIGTTPEVLQVLPSDVGMQYVPSPDLMAFSIRLWTVAQPDRYVEYDSFEDVITRSQAFWDR